MTPVLRAGAVSQARYEALGILVRVEEDKAFADLALEFTGLVEEQHLRGGGAVRGAARAVGAREDGDFTLRVDGDARRFAEVHPLGELQEIDIAVEGDLRHRRLLRAERRAERDDGRADDSERVAFRRKLHGHPLPCG